MGMEKDQLEEKLIRYFKAVEEVNKQSNLRREEKLKLLLEPIISLQDDTFPPNMEHKFTRDDYINLKEELDLSSLENTSDGWMILQDLKLQQFGDLDTSADIISVDYIKFLPESKRSNTLIKDPFVRTSIRSLYKDWLPHLSQERIMSRSLLDQILVCYTIKKAQNGDNQASGELISLYTLRAESKETYDKVLKMMTWQEQMRSEDKKIYNNVLTKMTWQYLEKIDQKHPYDAVDNDFRQLARIYLAFIINGFTAKSILDSISKGRESEFLPLPREIGDVFLYYFGEYVPVIVDKYTTYLNNVRESLKEPSNIHKLIKMIESMADLIECFNLQEKAGLKVDYLDFLKKNAELLQSDQVMEAAASIFPLAMKVSDDIAPYIATLLDPYTPINSEIAINKNDNQTVDRILSACYRPQNMSSRKNLTTWLFGGDGKSYVFGKLYQVLRDYYFLKATDVTSVPSYISPESEYPKEDEDEDETLKRYTNVEIDEIRERIDQVAFLTHDLSTIIKKANIAKKDFDLLLDYFGGFTLEDLAAKYNLTKDQIRYKFKIILKALQQSAKEI
jgi:hypothetical protein